MFHAQDLEFNKASGVNASGPLPLFLQSDLKCLQKKKGNKWFMRNVSGK